VNSRHRPTGTAEEQKKGEKVAQSWAHGGVGKNREEQRTREERDGKRE